jgi:hypothetical protein
MRITLDSRIVTDGKSLVFLGFFGRNRPECSELAKHSCMVMHMSDSHKSSNENIGVGAGGADLGSNPTPAPFC